MSTDESKDSKRTPAANKRKNVLNAGSVEPQSSIGSQSDSLGRPSSSTNPINRDIEKGDPGGNLSSPENKSPGEAITPQAPADKSFRIQQGEQVWSLPAEVPIEFHEVQKMLTSLRELPPESLPELGMLLNFMRCGIHNLIVLPHDPCPSDVPLRISKPTVTGILRREIGGFKLCGQADLEECGIKLDKCDAAAIQYNWCQYCFKYPESSVKYRAGLPTLGDHSFDRVDGTERNRPNLCVIYYIKETLCSAGRVVDAQLGSGIIFVVAIENGRHKFPIEYFKLGIHGLSCLLMICSLMFKGPSPIGSKSDAISDKEERSKAISDGLAGAAIITTAVGIFSNIFAPLSYAYAFTCVGVCVGLVVGSAACRRFLL